MIWLRRGGRTVGSGGATFVELLSPEPALPRVSEWIASSPHPVDVLEADPNLAERCLVALQVTDASVLGALTLNTGGIRIDHCWLRLLGSGHATMPGVDEANGPVWCDTADRSTAGW